jgi:hypothetical protein
MSRKKPEPSGRWLTEMEVREMCDSSLKDVQIQFLRSRGTPFTLSRLGRPLVLVSAIEGRENPAHARPLWQPAVMAA